MNRIDISDVLSQGLSQITYNGNGLVTPKDSRLNIFMGLGLWSMDHGLSEGLPIDVMSMLLSATLMRTKIMETNLGSSSKIILLLADSMAVREGAEKEKVLKVVEVYKKSLLPLLDLLNIKESSEFVLSSELETSQQYLEVVESIESSQVVQQLREEDEKHYAYIRTQTAIASYMNSYRQVGIKVGWIYADSESSICRSLSSQELKRWDELKFDRWCAEICKDVKMEYLYARAGVKQIRTGKSINLLEGCPYTAYATDQRYVIQTLAKKDITTIARVTKGVAARWHRVAEVCSGLMGSHIVQGGLLPEGCLQKEHAINTVLNMLNHWINLPVTSREEACDLLEEHYV